MFSTRRQSGTGCGDQQSSNQAIDKSTMSLLIPQGLHPNQPPHLQLHLHLLHSLHSLRLPSLATCIFTSQQYNSICNDNNGSSCIGGIAPSSVPPLSPNAPSALLAPAILTDRCALLPSYSFHETVNSDKYHHTRQSRLSYTFICFSRTDIIRYRDLVLFAIFSSAHAHPVPDIPNTKHPSIASVERTPLPSWRL